MRRTSTILAAAAIAASLACAGCQRSDQETAQKPPAPTAVPAAPPAASAPDRQSASAPDESPPEGTLRAYVWECDGGLTLGMKNLFRERAITLELHEGARKLPQLPSASGARYGDDSVEFWTKGGTATYQRKGTPAVRCRENRARSLAADAKARGVTFRGTGNEPGWTLEIGPEGGLVFITNYGQERHEFADATVSGDLQAGTVYAATHGGVSISATMRQEPCADDMAGTAFDYRFLVEFAGRTYRGCGDRLR